MSYCVNCGVELDSSSVECPLCHTPVINPSEILLQIKNPPFPKEKGSVETVKRKDLAILLSIVLISTGVTCALLNILVFNQSMWSLLIIGVCCCIWIFMIPVIIYTRLTIYASLLFDGLALGSYLFLITFVTQNDRWYFHLGIPIVLLLTIQTEIFTLLMRHIKISIITTSLYVFSNLAVLCVGLELIINHFLYGRLYIIWSAIVLTVCCIIIISLITILSQKRLRESIRRRMHF